LNPHLLFGIDIVKRRHIIYFSILVLQLITAYLLSKINLFSPYWLDEIFIGGVACQPSLSETLKLISTDIHPPLFPVYSNLIFDIFGCNLSYIRTINALVLVGSVCLFSYALKKRFGSICAIAFSTAFLGSASVWHYAFEARAYAFLMAIAILFLYGFIEKSWGISLAATTLAASLHYFGFYLFFVQIVLYYTCYRKPNKQEFLIYLFSFLLLCYLYFYPIPTGLKNSIKDTHPLFTRNNPEELINQFIVYFGTQAQFLSILFFTVFFFKKCIPASLLYKKIIAYCLSLSCFLILAVFLVSLSKPMFQFRYFLLMFPFICLSLSLIFQQASANKAYKKIILIFLLTYNISSSIIAFKIQHVRGYNWQIAAESSICKTQSCGFILDDPMTDKLSFSQYEMLSNYFNKINNNPKVIAWTLVRPKAFSNWLSNNKNKPFIYLKSGQPYLKLERFYEYNLKCDNFKDTNSFICYPKDFEQDLSQINDQSYKNF
jgi:hypothetical protein